MGAVRSSLPDFAIWVAYQALKRWAIVVRPSGAGLHIELGLDWVALGRDGRIRGRGRPRHTGLLAPRRI